MRSRELTRRGQAALGGEEFAAAYAKGWELDGKTAVTAADPARHPGNSERTDDDVGEVGFEESLRVQEFGSGRSCASMSTLPRRRLGRLRSFTDATSHRAG